MKFPKYKYYFAFVDFLILLLSFLITQYLLSGPFYHKLSKPFNGFELTLPIYTVASFICLFIFQSNNLYKINIILTRAKHLSAIIKSLFYGIVTLIILSYIIKFHFIPDSRLYIIAFAIVVLFAFLIIRVFILRSLYLYFTERDIIYRNAVIVGAGNSGKMLAAKLLFENSYGVKLLGFVDDSIQVGEIVVGNLKVLGEILQLPFLKIRDTIDEVIVAIDHITYERLLEILDICNLLEVRVKLTSELFDIVPKKFITENYSGIPLVEASPRMNEKLSIVYKRLFDIFAALGGIILLSPFFIIIGLIIKFSSIGPVFYKSKRIGKDGKPFMFYKFRSMTISKDDDAERKQMMIEFMKNNRAQGAGDTKIINESRVTKIGKFIRRTSIDELPQLINVLKGDMSLVGPRPCLPYEYENYDEWQKRRVAVLPGCTGVWQVSGRSEVSFKDSVVLDLYYINNMTPWLDLQIILKTIPVMVLARGGK